MPLYACDRWWDEQILDHRHLVSAVAGLVERPDLAAFGGCRFETSMVGGVARGFRFRSYRERRSGGAEIARVPGAWQAPMDAGERYERRLSYPGADLRTGLQLLAYPDFGLYIFRSQRLFLALRCGALGQEGNGGHDHNDQLALELEVDGATVYGDPGSYVYTALQAERNRYRSDHAHAGFRAPQRESADVSADLFMLRGNPRARCLYFDDTRFVGEHSGFGFPVVRAVEVQADAVLIRDFVLAMRPEERALHVVPFYAATGAERVPFSPGYGKLAR
jgi:hypothetical protein